MNAPTSLIMAARRAGAVWNPISRQWQFKNAGGDHWVTLHGKYNVNESGDKNYRRVLLDGGGKIVGGDIPKSAQGKNISSWWKKDEGQDLSSQEREDFVSYAQRMKGKHLKSEDILSKLDALKESSPDAHKKALDAFREDYSKNQGVYQKEREERSRTYLTVPYSEKEAAKKAGAKWDKDKGSWYFPGKDNVPSELNQWKPGTTEAKGKQEQKAAERVYLDVPYDEKDKAKRAGARWDSGKRQWYYPDKENMPSALDQWKFKYYTPSEEQKKTKPGARVWDKENRKWVWPEETGQKAKPTPDSKDAAPKTGTSNKEIGISALEAEGFKVERSGEDEYAEDYKISKGGRRTEVAYRKDGRWIESSDENMDLVEAALRSLRLAGVR